MTKTTFNPDTLFNSVQFGFSQVVAQVWQSLRNVETAVTAAGATLKDVVALRIYIVQDWMDSTAPDSEGLKAFFPNNPPATTWVEVHGLARPEFLIEIEGTAVA